VTTGGTVVDDGGTEVPAVTVNWWAPVPIRDADWLAFSLL
jgi:hypothetical protein